MEDFPPLTLNRAYATAFAIIMSVFMLWDQYKQNY